MVDMELDDEITYSDPTRWHIYGRWSIPVDWPLTAFLVLAAVVVAWMTYSGMHADVQLPTGTAPVAASGAAGTKAEQVMQQMAKMQGTAHQGQAGGTPVKIAANSSLPADKSVGLRHQFYFALLGACQINAQANKALFDDDMNAQLASQNLNSVLGMGISYSRIDDMSFRLTLTGSIPSDIQSSAEYDEIQQNGERVTPAVCADVASQLRALAAPQSGGGQAGQSGGQR